MSKKEKKNRVGWRTTGGDRAWYFIGRIGTTNLQAIIPNFMNLFLIFNGVDLGLVAAITLIVKIIDSVDDMIFGFLVDKIDLKKSKLLSKLGGAGRYFPWLRCFMYFFPFAIFLFFLMPSSLSSFGKAAWFAVTYLLFDFTYTLVDVPVQSTLMTLTDVPEERNHIVTWGYVFVTITLLATSLVQQFLISETVGLSIRTVALGSMVLFTLMMIPMPFKLKETNTELKNVEKEVSEHYTVREMLRAVWNNKPYLISTLSKMIPSILATGSGVGLFVSYYLFGESTALLLPSVGGAILMVFFEMAAPAVSKKMGNKKGLVVSMVVMTICSIGTYLVGYQNYGAVVMLLLISSAFGGIVTMIRGYVIFDTIEYGKYINGRDTTGIFNAINTFTDKITGSVASSLGLILLSLFGWTTVNAESFADLAAQGIEQSASALNGLWIINAMVPAIGAVLGLVTILFYRLPDKDVKLMGQCNAGEISREECESKLSRKY